MIITFLNQETLAAQQATASIPIVMFLGIYPVQAGLVSSLARPGGNITGTTVGPVTGGKYLELLKEAFPKLTRVAVLLDPTFPGLADAAVEWGGDPGGVHQAESMRWASGGGGTAPSLLGLPPDRLVVTRKRKGVKNHKDRQADPAPIRPSGRLKKWRQL